MEPATAKEAFAKLKPESCVFVLSVDENGKASGMVAGWHMKCSMEPPLFAVALKKKAYTHNLIRQSKEFVIAVPNEELEKEVIFFGSTHGDEVDKFKETGIETEEPKYLDTPLIKKATINMECTLEKEVDSGDHIIFIGRVLAAYINKDKKVLFNMMKIEDNRIFKDL